MMLPSLPDATAALLPVLQSSDGLSTTTTVAVIAALVLVGFAWFILGRKPND